MHEFTKWIHEWSNGQNGWLARFITRARELKLFEFPEDGEKTIIHQFYTFQESRLQSFIDYIDSFANRLMINEDTLYEILERLMFAIVPDVTRIQDDNASSFALAYPVSLWLQEHWTALRVLMIYFQQVHDKQALRLLSTRIPFTLFIYESKVFPHMTKLNDQLRHEATHLSIFKNE